MVGNQNKKEEKKKKMVEEEQFYPPEEMFREEFVKSVEEAEKRVKEGKARTFKNASELNAFLESLKTSWETKG